MLKIIHSGLLTMVQDGGRVGYRNLGVSQCGALDLPALHIANLLVGNPVNYAGLEITLGQLSLSFTRNGWIALTGADCKATLDGKPIWTGWRYPVKTGQTLKLNKPLRGMRSYLAAAGGIAVPEILGSYSTDMVAKFGGFEGRPLKDGDVVPVGKPLRKLDKSVGVQQMLFNNRIRALVGPEFNEFSQQSQANFWRTPWQLSPNSNRMGYRLNGAEIRRETQREMLSHGVLPGVIQVPHNGQPIVLMADAQTTGGYPRIASIISADLYHLAQIRLGEAIHFIPCTLAEAEKALLDQKRFIQQIEWGLYGR
jgi:biotin-dependent carboxylase-like uncharacterized protein